LLFNLIQYTEIHSKIYYTQINANKYFYRLVLLLIKRDVMLEFYFRCGITLMVFGEVGNFTAYAFAPASLVAPLGTTTVIGELFLHFLNLFEREQTNNHLTSCKVLTRRSSLQSSKFFLCSIECKKKKRRKDILWSAILLYHYYFKGRNFCEPKKWRNIWN